MKKYRFLVDVNLPRKFSFFESGDFQFVSDISSYMSDTKIWDLAISQELIILTKDSDFYSRALVSTNKPKVIYFKLGNMLLKDLEQYFIQFWPQILDVIDEHTLIVANRDSIDILI